MPVLARPTDWPSRSQRQKDLIPNKAHIGASEEERGQAITMTMIFSSDLLCLCCTETKKTHPPVQPKRRPFLFGIGWSWSYLSPLCSLLFTLYWPLLQARGDGKWLSESTRTNDDDDETIAAFVFRVVVFTLSPWDSYCVWCCWLPRDASLHSTVNIAVQGTGLYV